MESENPYLSPVVSGKGEYDWTLFKRVFMWFAFMSIFYLLCDLFVIWDSWDARTLPSDSTPLEQIKAFFFGWKAG